MIIHLNKVSDFINLLQSKKCFFCKTPASDHSWSVLIDTRFNRLSKCKKLVLDNGGEIWICANCWRDERLYYNIGKAFLHLEKIL